MPIFYLLSRAFVHDAPFARQLLEWAVPLYAIRLDAVAVIPWTGTRQKNFSCLPPTWTNEELGKRMRWVPANDYP